MRRLSSRIQRHLSHTQHITTHWRNDSQYSMTDATRLDLSL